MYNFIQQLHQLAVVESKKKLPGKRSHSITSLFMGILKDRIIGGYEFMELLAEVGFDKKGLFCKMFPK